MLTVADGMCYSLRDSFVQYVLPYLSEQEMQEWRERLRPHLTLANWPTGWNRPPAAFLIAPYLGLHEQIMAVVWGFPDGSCAGQ